MYEGVAFRLMRQVAPSTLDHMPMQRMCRLRDMWRERYDALVGGTYAPGRFPDVDTLIERHPECARALDTRRVLYDRRFLIAFESMLATPEAREVFGDATILDDPAGDVTSANASGFRFAFSEMIEHVSGVHAPETGALAGQALIPISPLDPAFRDSEAVLAAGDNQLLFAALPGDMSRVEMAGAVERWHDARTAESAYGVPVVVADVERLDSGEYLVKGYTGHGEGYGFNNKTLRTTADELGLSALRRHMGDDAAYERLADPITQAWDRWFEGDAAKGQVRYGIEREVMTRLSRGGREPSRDEVARAVDAELASHGGERMARFRRNRLAQQRELVETVVASIVDWARGHGITPRFELDSVPGQMLMVDDASGVTWRLVDQPGASDEARRRFCCKPRINRSDDFELDIRTPGNVSATGATRPGREPAIAHPERLYTLEDRIALSEFACGLTTESYLPEGRTPLVGRDAQYAIARSDKTLYVPLREKRVRIGGEVRPMVLYAKRTPMRTNDYPAVTNAPRTAEEQEQIRYNDNGMPYTVDDDGNHVPAARTHEDIVRFSVESARASVARQIDVEGLIDAAEQWYTSTDRAHFPRPSFDRDGTVDDRFVIQARHDLWDMLTGRMELLDKPYTPTTREVELDPYGEKLAPEGGNPVMSQTDRYAYARAYVSEVCDRRIGTFDATYDMDGRARRFNMAEVIRYANGIGGARSTDVFVRACREARIDPAELRGDEALGSEGDYANQLRDRIAPFVEGAGMRTLAELEGADDLTPADEYRRFVLRTVADTASMYSSRPVEASDVAIDRFGLVRYRFAQSLTIKVKPGSELPLTTGYIGRFAVPEDTLAGALRLVTPYAENRIIHKQASAYVLPRDEVGSSRLERTRVVSFDDQVRNLIVRTVARDVTGAPVGGSREVGSFDAMRPAYRSDMCGRCMSADVYDRLVEEAEAYERDPERFRAEALDYIADPESVGDDVVCPLPHNPRPAYTLEELTALERTRNAEVNYDRAFEEVNVATELGVTRGGAGAVGTSDLPSDRVASVEAVADWHSMATLTPEERAVFDVAMTKDTKKQCTKRYLVDGAEVSADRAPVPGVTGRCAMRGLPVFKNADESAWNRQRMGGANYETGLMCDPTTRVAMMGGGGWTQDDGIVVSREFAETHRIHGADNVVRDLRRGDKISDLHGNKGVIAAVVDTSLSEEAAAARGEAYHRLWQVFAANVDAEGHCRIDVMMNNVAPVSRKNSGLFRDMLEGEREALHLPDGTEVADAISTIPIEVHNKAVDKQTNFDNDSNTGWQLAYALADHEPHIMAEIYGDAASGVRRIREALRVSVGADMADNGQLTSELLTGPGYERRLIEVAPVAPQGGYGDPASPETMATVSAYPVGYAHEANTLEAVMQHIDHEGGFIHVPFSLTYPEHTVSGRDTSSATQLTRKAFGLPEGADATIGGGQIARDGLDANGNEQWLLPIESAHGRASLEARGRQMRHDHSRAYQTIMRNAIRYENLRVQRDAYKRELERLEQIPEAERATTVVEHYYTGSTVGSIRGEKTADKVIARYRAVLEGTPGRGGRKATRGLEDQMADCQAAAQAQFTRLANEVWTRNFTTSDNNIKNAVMRAPVVDSTYCVWTPDPDLHLNEVRVGVKQAEKIGAVDGDTVALWRSPVLLESNICALTVRVDDTIDGCAVNPAIAGRIAGDFDGDKVSLWKPAYEGSREELAEKLSLERFLVNDRTAPSGTRVVDDNGTPREVKVYGLEVGLGLDAKLGRGIDAHADELMSRGEDLALLAWDKWAAGEFGERDSDEALRARDEGCREALAALDEGIRLAQQASCGARALSFTDEVTCVNSFLDATVNPSVKGKPKDVAEVMTYLGLVPNKPDTLAAHVEAGDLPTYLQGHCEGESLLDEFGMKPDDDGRYHLDGSEFLSVAAMQRGTYEGELDPGEQRALVDGWERSREEAAASVSMAMDAKTNVTGPVGALPQGGYKAMPQDHTLIARLFQPLYQMSLDFKLDGYDAMAKVPYVTVFKDLVNRGRVYEELLDGRCTADFDAADLTPRSSSEPLTPDDFKRAMTTLYERMGQDVNPELIDKVADVLSVERRDASGKTVTVVETLPEFAAEHGATLDYLAFDTSDTGNAAILAIAGRCSLFDERSQEMAPLEMRVQNDWPCMNVEQEARAMSMHGSFEHTDVRAVAGERVAANTRGLDVACEMGDPQVSVLYGQAADTLDEEQTRTLNKSMLSRFGDGTRVLVGYAKQGSVHEALLDACSRSDALVLVGDGTTSTVCVPYADNRAYENVEVDDVMAYAAELGCAVVGVDVVHDGMFEARFDAGDTYDDYVGVDATMDARSAEERGRASIVLTGRLPEEGCVREMPRGADKGVERGIIAHPYARSREARAYEGLKAAVHDELARRLEDGPIEVISSGERGGDAVALMAALDLRDEQPAERRGDVRVVLAPHFDDQESLWDRTSKRETPYFSRERYRQLAQAVDEVRLPGVRVGELAGTEEMRSHLRTHDQRLINQATDVMAVVRADDRMSDARMRSFSRVMANVQYATSNLHKPATLIDSTAGSVHEVTREEPAWQSRGVFVMRDHLGVFKTPEQIVRERQVAAARESLSQAQASAEPGPEVAADPTPEAAFEPAPVETSTVRQEVAPALDETAGAGSVHDDYEMGM